MMMVKEYLNFKMTCLRHLHSSVHCVVFENQLYYGKSLPLPSVGVKEGLSCVFASAKWRGKARNLALP